MNIGVAKNVGFGTLHFTQNSHISKGKGYSSSRITVAEVLIDIADWT